MGACASVAGLAVASVTMPDVSLMKSRKLGEGHFATVYLTRHHGDLVAAKVLHPDHGDVDAELIIRDLRHKNIVRFIDVVPRDSSVWILTEFLPISVSDLVAYAKPSLAVALSLTAQLLDALCYLHSQGIAHRDLKLENLMLTPDSHHLKVIDFGLATRLLRGGRPQRYASHAYAAPEVLAQVDHDPRKADVWSAAVCAFAMFVGQFPFRRADNQCRFFRRYEEVRRLDITDGPPPKPRRSTLAFCRRLFVVDWTRRPTAAAARRHLAATMALAALGG